jgi:eukaryotic-like serine/threonine-protein kinase
MAIAAGIVLGPYRVLEEIGAGGMGQVYRARDSQLERDVAIKVLPGLASSNPERLRRFEQEARAAAALNHPNILVVHHMDRYHGVPYLVSELLEGETLRDRLNGGPLALRKVIDYGTQIARGLAAAHEKGIVHRDLKPENLFITKDGHVKILDFGLARMLEPQLAMAGGAQTLATQTHPGTVLGTPGYMSPEQVRGQPADHRTDIFVFAAILQEMITGKRVFEKETSAETMTAILNEDPPPMADFVPVTPTALQHLVHRGMEKDPERRFQSASDMGFALEALAEATSITVPAGRVLPTMRSRGGRAAVLATAIAVLAAIGALAWKWLRVPAAPTVSNYVQLTHDGLQKLLIGTDGARLYLSLINSGVQRVTAMPVSGGEETPIPMPAPGMAPVDLSSDGSAFLVVDGQGFPAVGPFWTVPVLGRSPQRLGETVGNAAAWSPDRQMLAYSDRGDLYVAKADGTEPRKLLTMTGLISDVAWSPQGDYLRFGASNFSQTASSGIAIGQQAIWQVSADGSKLHELLSGWHDAPDECCGKWTANGKYFIFQSRGQIWALPERSDFLHSGARPLQLTASPMALNSPLPSKDGRKLFVVGRTYRGELTRFDLKSGTTEPFLGGISAEWLDFSKDGQWVTYISYPEGVLWKSKVDGSNRRQLTFPPFQPVLPRWSPDGKSILFFEFPVRSGQPGLMYQISSDGGTPRQFLPDDRHDQQDPTWSPDGTRIAFAGAANDAAVGNAAAGIRVLSLANHQISRIPGSERLFSPRWSPDGRYLAAMTSDSGALLLFDFQTQTWTDLARGTFGWPVWSTDGKFIYVKDFTGSGGVDRIRISDHRIEKVVDLNDFLAAGQADGGLSLLPDGSPLLLRDRGTQDVYAVDWNE